MKLAFEKPIILVVIMSNAVNIYGNKVLRRKTGRFSTNRNSVESNGLACSSFRRRNLPEVQNKAKCSIKYKTSPEVMKSQENELNQR